MSRSPLNLIFIWQSLVAANYRSFFYALSSRHKGGSIDLVSPIEFIELGSQKITAPAFTHPFDNSVKARSGHLLPVLRFHTQIVFYQGLRKLFTKIHKSKQQEVAIFSMSEPYALTTFFHLLTAKLVFGRNFKFVFFALQNINKNFSLPLRLIQSYVFKNSHLALVLGTEHEAVLRLQGFKGPCQYFPLWFDKSRFKFEPGNRNNQKFKIGYIGSLTEAKGLKDLMAALTNSSLNDVAKEFQVSFAGVGPLAQEINEWCTKSSDFNAKFLGPLSGDQVADFFRGLDLLVVPSRTTANWKEQFGRVIVEAWACGCKVIGSSSGEIPHLMGDKDLIFMEQDPFDLARVIRSQFLVWKSSSEDSRSSTSNSIAVRALREFSDEALADRFLLGLNKNLLK